MESTVFVKSFEEPKFNKSEILRYAGQRKEDEQIYAIMEECILKVREKLTYMVCWRKFPIYLGEDYEDLSFTRTNSSSVRKKLENCGEIILFGATVGMEIDRLISRYQKISPVKALMFQAIGAERIEALCDTFFYEMAEEYGKRGRKLKERFSPGYGDFSIETQRDILRALGCDRKIGLKLSESLLMSPSKSVTAVIGIL